MAHHYEHFALQLVGDCAGGLIHPRVHILPGVHVGHTSFEGFKHSL